MFPVFSSSSRVSISKDPVLNICQWSPGHQTLKDRLSKMKNTPKLQTSACSKVKRQVIICTLYGLLLFVVLHWHPLFWLWEKNLGVRRKKYGLWHGAAGETDTWCAHASMCTGGGGCRRGKEDRANQESEEKQVIRGKKGRCVLFKALTGSEGDQGRRRWRRSEMSLCACGEGSQRQDHWPASASPGCGSHLRGWNSALEI